MIRCAVIDDEPVAIGILEEYIAKVPFLRCDASFRSALDALEYIRSNEVDAVFLDINMPDCSGLDFLKSLDRCPLVVFTTAYSEYAAESYDYEAVDYLVKPIELERFLKAVGRLVERFNAGRNGGGGAGKAPDRGGSIIVKDGTSYHRLDIDNILYIKGAGNYVEFVTTGGRILSLMTMGETLDMLPAGRFVRIHRSYIAAFDRIDVIEPDQVILGGEPLPIGEAYRGELQRMVQSRR